MALMCADVAVVSLGMSCQETVALQVHRALVADVAGSALEDCFWHEPGSVAAHGHNPGYPPREFRLGRGLWHDGAAVPGRVTR